MFNTDDPLRDFQRWQDEEYLWEMSRPICDDCGEHITDEYMWEFHGLHYCENCVRNHRERIED